MSQPQAETKFSFGYVGPMKEDVVICIGLMASDFFLRPHEIELLFLRPHETGFRAKALQLTTRDRDRDRDRS